MRFVWPLLATNQMIFFHRNSPLAARQNCLNGLCAREIVVDDRVCGISVTLFTNLTLKIDQYHFTADQLQKSPYFKMKTFVVSKVGDSIIFVSHLQNFWVRLTNAGDVKVGISSKREFGVDGLCGFYNGFQFDDRRLPNGTIVMSSVDFGDAWANPNASQRTCEQLTCREDLQAQAMTICQSVKDETFAACSKSVNVEHFVSRCMESACVCLEKSKTPNEQESCKCSSLQNFVTECMAADASVHLDVWRSKYECVVDCPTPLVHQDCYQRRCEPTCDTLNDNDCPFLPGTCFTGCYCPPGRVRSGEKCVAINECKNCICDGFGGSQFITYDRRNFTFNGNCTYLLTRDIMTPNEHAFQVYATIGQCFGHTAQTSCTQSLHIIYGSHIVHLQRANESISAILDGIVQQNLPYKSPWVSVEANTRGISVNFIESQIEISAILDDLSFSIRVPSIKYGSKLEGLCGDCNGNPSDDLRPNPKYKEKMASDAVQDIVRTWLSDEPRLGKENECVSEEKTMENCVPLPPDEDPCVAILSPETFGHCHVVVDPAMYVSLCQIDMCKVQPNQKGACVHLAAYARECSRNGVCLEWKQGICHDEAVCPAEMEWKACGCQRTCESIKDVPIFVNITCLEPNEGCFCRDDKVLSNGKCVPENQCAPCDDKGHFAGDKWHTDKCTTCECTASGQTDCVVEKCPSKGEICKLGFKQAVIEAVGECCPSYKCIPDEKKCEDSPIPICNEHQFVKLVSDASKCSKYVCDCKPLDQCEPSKLRALQPGEQIIEEAGGCCPTSSIICDKSKCPSKPAKCDQDYYVVVVDDAIPEDSCCPQFKCVPPKNACIVPADGGKQLKNVGETWSTDDACSRAKCAYGEDGALMVVQEKQPCSVSSCAPGFELETFAGKCCGECVQHMCVINDTVYQPGRTWLGQDNCTIYECARHDKQLLVLASQPVCPNIDGCPAEQIYVENCCKKCKGRPEAQSESKLHFDRLLSAHPQRALLVPQKTVCRCR